MEHQRRSWTAEEEEFLRQRIGKQSGKSIAKRLNRSITSIHQRARHLGVRARRPWSAADDAFVRETWGELPAAKIGRRLRRSGDAVTWRARRLGLPIGPLEGTEHITHAARRLGFTVITLRKILARAGVEIQRTASRPYGGYKGDKPNRRCLCVDKVLAEAAVRDWLASEKIEQAARDRGVSRSHLVTRLRALKGLPKRPAERGQHWRIPTTLIDRAMAISPQKLRRLRSERLSAAQKVAVCSLCKQPGHKRTWKKFHPKEETDHGRTTNHDRSELEARPRDASELHGRAREALRPDHVRHRGASREQETRALLRAS